MITYDVQVVHATETPHVLDDSECDPCTCFAVLGGLSKVLVEKLTAL